MRKIYLYILLVGIAFTACKKSSDPEPTTEPPAPTPTMSIKLTGTQLFLYNITESDTVTHDFGVREGYDVTAYEVSFTPVPGHKVQIEATTKSPAPVSALTAVATYKGVALGPITPKQTTANTYISFGYVVPK